MERQSPPLPQEGLKRQVQVNKFLPTLSIAVLLS